MARSTDAYKAGMMYEVFMRRAFRSYDNSRQELHCSVIQNLAQIETGDTSFEKWHGSFAYQLSAAKSNVKDAMAKYLKMDNVSSENKQRLAVLALQVDNAASSSDLMSIILEAIELTQSAKEF